jgi:acyl dehydratase
MHEFASPRDLLPFVGKSLGAGDWLTVDQETIDAFADATDDHQWIHVDPERAKREMPGGKTIAHGFLTLSLLPKLTSSVLAIKGRSRTLNYGSNKVRFTAPVPAGSRIRVRLTLKSAEPVAGGIRLIFDNVVEIEGEEKPALVAETVQIAYL